MPVEREIINVYDVFEPMGPLTHIFFAPGRRPVPRWGAVALTAPLRLPHIQNVNLISDHSLAALPFRHLAINLSGGDIYAKTAA